MAQTCGCHGHQASTALEGPAKTEAAASAGAPLDRVLVDVRDDIRRGVEPFARIMTAVQDLAAGQVLVLRAPFEPIPLYSVLGKRGFTHCAESRAADDWWITFSRGTATTPAPEASATSGQASTTLDVRGLEPPHPLVRVLEALDRVPVGGELIVLHERRPVFLYPQLEARGFVHETDEPAAGVIRIRIRHAAPTSESTAGA
jgi:uncharacterized protein (DUF2249 family)